MMRKQRVGRLGENLACRYLKKKGYKILERNFQKREGEIDILALDKKAKMLVFVEVKTRTSGDFGEPQEAVDFFKQRKLLRTAYAYLNEKGIEQDFRVDVVGITLDYPRRSAHLEHFKNAVEE